MEENKTAQASPVDNSRLIAAFQAAAKEDTPENKNRMIDEVVMRAKFLIPVVIEDENGVKDGAGGSIGKDDRIKFFSITNKNAEKFLMGFTSVQELAKWGKGENRQVLVFGFDNYAALLGQSAAEHAGWVIDPFGANLILPAPLVAALAEEKKKRLAQLNGGATVSSEIPAGTEIRLAQPKNYPISMVKDIKKYLKTQDSVSSAYLQLMQRGEKQSFLIIVDSSEENTDIFKGVVEAARAQNSVTPIELIWKSTPFGKKAIANVAPFYIK